MQKLLRRTAQAEKQAARRKAKRNEPVKRASQNQDFKKRMMAVKNANQALNDARVRRREDWTMGPLAPQRDTPIRDAGGAYWGSMSLVRAMGSIPQKQRDLACKWAGGSRHLCLKVGDKVAIMQGPDKGKIGLVRTIVENEGSVILEGDHLQQNVTVSEYLAKAKLAGHEKRTQLAPLHVPIWAIRLVHPLRDPETGKVRDVIINELAPTGIVHDKPTGRETWERVVPSMNIKIPWPRAFEEAEREAAQQLKVDYECDTLRLDVEERTFVPTLVQPPMPTGIIDELRNRYSKFRTRHEPEYIAKKEAEEREKLALKKAASSMRTPLQELNALLREERRQRGQPVLTDDMLVRIGEMMARNHHRAPAIKKVSQGLIDTAEKRAEDRKAKERLLVQSQSALSWANELEVEAGKAELEAGKAEVEADKVVELRAKAEQQRARAKKLRAKATAKDDDDDDEVKARALLPPPAATGVPVSAAAPEPMLFVPESAPRDTAPPPS